MNKSVNKLIRISEMLQGVKNVPTPIILQLKNVIKDINEHQKINWHEVKSKEDLPKEYGCYLFCLHNHEKAYVCAWDAERVTDTTAATISYWAEISNLPVAPK